MDDLSGLMRGLGDAAGGAGDDPMQAANGLASAIQEQGGLDSLLGKLREAGYGSQVDSWIGTGPNQELQPQQLADALGPTQVQGISNASGLDLGALLPLLAAFLPQIVSMLTPKGEVPAGGLDSAAGSGGVPDLGGLLGGVLGGAAGGSAAGGSGGLDDLLGGLGGLLGGDKGR